jgi:hypothetical protein
MNTCVPLPEAGPPEAGREGGSDVAEGGSPDGSEGGADTGPDAPVVDAPVDVTSDG